MTRQQERFAEVLLAQTEGMDRNTAIRTLIEKNLINHVLCERIAICNRLLEMEREGIPRCEAMLIVADTFCCSYEKVRDSFYNHLKSKNYYEFGNQNPKHGR